jgi:hypothetical protein
MMGLWSKIKALFEPDEIQVEPPQLEEKVPCFVCETSVSPGEHLCVAIEQPKDLFTQFIHTRRALKSLVFAIENNLLTQEQVEDAKAALRLS